MNGKAGMPQTLQNLSPSCIILLQELHVTKVLSKAASQKGHMSRLMKGISCRFWSSSLSSCADCFARADCFDISELIEKSCGDWKGCEVGTSWGSDLMVCNCSEGRCREKVGVGERLSVKSRQASIVASTSFLCLQSMPCSLTGSMLLKSSERRPKEDEGWSGVGRSGEHGLIWVSSCEVPVERWCEFDVNRFYPK